jgi:hypothetical protein
LTSRSKSTGEVTEYKRMLTLIKLAHEHEEKIGHLELRKEDFLTDDSIEVTVTFYNNK